MEYIDCPRARSDMTPCVATGMSSELERRIQKLEQMVDGIRCWTEQHDAALEEEDSHE